jgi:hypothetical protein
VDEHLRGVVREAEHAHDGTLWLKAASALARAREFDDAGRALLWARALGAETGPIDDMLVPSTLEFERRAVGSMLLKQPLVTLEWAPEGDRVFVVSEGCNVLALGTEPGNNARLAAFPMDVIALGPTLRGDGLWVGLYRDGEWFLSRFDLAAKRFGSYHSRSMEQIDRIVAFGADPNAVVCSWSQGVAIEYRREPDEHLELSGWSDSVEDGTLTWIGRVARPGVQTGLDQRTVTFIFGELFRRIDFPTQRSVQVYTARATSGVLDLAPHAVRDNASFVSAAPSGRHVAIGLRSPPGLRLVDLVGNSRAQVALDTEPFDARWSPSGRRLAVLTADRVHILTFTS